MSRIHCPVCGFMMMPEDRYGRIWYVCPNQAHTTIGEANQGVHMSENMADLLRGMGPNLDLILRGYEKKSPSSPIEE